MADKPQGTSHSEALKSTSIIGGSAAVMMVIRMVRTKLLAILLGPSGVGLEGIYESALSVARTLVDLGISNSGVRQIAAAVSSGETHVIATTVITLRRVCLILGIIGTVALFLCREPVSRTAFGNADHAGDIGLLSVTLFLGAVSGGQAVLLTGTRRIADLAKMNIIGTLAGACISIPIVYFWGRNGIVWYMIAAAAVAVLTSWFYARRVPIDAVRITPPQAAKEAVSLLKLGLVFVSTGLMSTGAMFLIRSFVTRQEGLLGTGQFQAAYALSAVYIGFVLQAMGTDFYPRLTSVANDNQRCNQLVNEQAEISILLALPGVLATLAVAPWVIHLFYSNKFNLATDILCWQVTGMFLQVNSWPMGFIIVAKGRAAVLFWTDLVSYSLYVALAWFGLQWFGLPGVGMAFVGLYLFHWFMVFVIVRKMSGFVWSPQNILLSTLGITAVVVTLALRLKLPEPWATIVGGGITASVGVYCLKNLAHLVGREKISRYARKFGLSFFQTKNQPN